MSPFARYRVLVLTLLLTLRFSLSLRLLGMRGTLTRLSLDLARTAVLERPSPAFSAEELIRLSNQLLQNVLFRRLLRVRCLEESLVQYRILKRYGHAAEVRIGVRTEGGFSGHAWLTHGEDVSSELSRSAVKNDHEEIISLSTWIKMLQSPSA